MRHASRQSLLWACWIVLITLSGCQGWQRKFNPYDAYGAATIPPPGTNSYSIPGSSTGGDSYYNQTSSTAGSTGSQITAGGAPANVPATGGTQNGTGWRPIVGVSHEESADGSAAVNQLIPSTAPVGTGVARAGQQDESRSVLSQMRDQRLPLNDATNVRAPDRFVAPQDAQPIQPPAANPATALPTSTPAPTRIPIRGAGTPFTDNGSVTTAGGQVTAVATTVPNPVTESQASAEDTSREGSTSTASTSNANLGWTSRRFR